MPIHSGTAPQKVEEEREGDFKVFKTEENLFIQTSTRPSLDLVKVRPESERQSKLREEPIGKLCSQISTCETTLPKNDRENKRQACSQELSFWTVVRPQRKFKLFNQAKLERRNLAFAAPEASKDPAS